MIVSILGPVWDVDVLAMLVVVPTLIVGLTFLASIKICPQAVPVRLIGAILHQPSGNALLVVVFMDSEHFEDLVQHGQHAVCRAELELLTPVRLIAHQLVAILHHSAEERPN